MCALQTDTCMGLLTGSLQVVEYNFLPVLLLYCSESWSHQHPLHLQMLDFPEWLGLNTAPGDTIILHLDLDGARQFDILQSLLLSSKLSLISQLDVRWHYQAEVTPTAGI